MVLTYTGEGYKNDEIAIQTGTIFDIYGQFDLIMFHHSFEHMEQPFEIMKKVYSLLKGKNSYYMI